MRGTAVTATVAVLALLTALGASAQDGQGALDEANALYRDGQFAQAAEAYREALADGSDGPRTHYNLANALYRSGQPGEAIAHYQAALSMAPRDGDIRANLDRALAQRPATSGAAGIVAARQRGSSRPRRSRNSRRWRRSAGGAARGGRGAAWTPAPQDNAPDGDRAERADTVLSGFAAARGGLPPDRAGGRRD